MAGTKIKKNRRLFPLLSLKDFLKARLFLVVALLFVAFFGIVPYFSDILGADEKSIGLSLEYGNSPFYDSENDGVENQTGIIDMGLDPAFSWEIDESYLASRWEIINKEKNTSQVICNGALEACSFAELIQNSDQWNDTLYLGYGAYGAGYNNTIAAQIFYVNISKPEILSSPWTHLDAIFIRKPISGNETMNITFNETSNQSMNNVSLSCAFPSFSIYLNESMTLSLGQFCLDDEALDYSVIKEENVSAIFDESNALLALFTRINETGTGLVGIRVQSYNESMEFEIPIHILKKEPRLCEMFENITIEKNSFATIDLVDYCADIDNATLLAYSQNLSILFNDSTATLIPSRDFAGEDFIYFTIKTESSYETTNVFKVSVVEPSIEEHLGQQFAQIGKPVRWVQTISSNVESNHFNFTLPAQAYNLSIQKNAEGNQTKIDHSSVVLYQSNRKKDLQQFELEQQIGNIKEEIPESTGSERAQLEQKMMELERLLPKKQGSLGEFLENKTAPVELIINDRATEVVVEYFTAAPQKQEEQISETKKEIIIYSDLHYENVLAYTDIPQVPVSGIKLFWMQNETKIPFTDVTYIDTNKDDLIDRLEWVVPHLSNQTFELSLEVLDLQSYPMIGGKWNVRFRTYGTKNLTILAYNDTSYTEKENDNPSTSNDLSVFELKCEDTILFNYEEGIIASNVYLMDENNEPLKIEDTLGNEIPIKSMFVQDYNCDNKTAVWTVNVISAAKHTQQFIFGNLSGFANNYALNPRLFVDDTEAEFGLGNFSKTNLSGTGATANVTLNYTLSRYNVSGGNKIYNLSGNFTSRVFDTGQNISKFDKIAWVATLVNTTDVVGMAIHDAASDAALFLRNGSFIVDTTQTNLNSIVSFTNDLNAYTVPADYRKDDILGIGVDSDSNVVYAFFRNGSTLNATEADFTTDMTFGSPNTWSIPPGYNASDVIGFAIDDDNNGAAIFFNNGTFIHASTEAAPFSFNTSRVHSAVATLEGYLNNTDYVAVGYSTAGNDIALFHKNGTYISDNVQTTFNTNILFNVRFTPVYNSALIAGINLTINSTINISARVSNDTILWSNWTGFSDPEGSISINRRARYIQYKADFWTPRNHITPFLENVSINYSIDDFVPYVNASINDSTIQRYDVINFSAKPINDTNGVSWCQFIDNMTSAKRYFNLTANITSAQCSQNYTVFLPRSGVINFTLLVNDTFGNINRTQFIIEVANTRPNVTILYPLSDFKASWVNFPINVTGFDIDNDSLTYLIYSNGVFNHSTTANTTFNASEGTYWINVSSFDGFNFSVNATINFSIDRTRPLANGTLNKTSVPVRIYNVINGSFNATDSFELSFGRITINDTGIRRYFNTSLRGQLRNEFSQNFSVSCNHGCVVNVSGFVNDSSGNSYQNDTLFVVENTPPTSFSMIYPLSGFNISLQSVPLRATYPSDPDNDQLNLTFYIDGQFNHSSPVNSTLNASEGTYALNVSLFDGYNFSNNVTINFTLDRSPPKVSLESPGNNTWNNTATILFRYNTTDILSGSKNCSIIFSGPYGLPFTNITQSSLTGSFVDSGGSQISLTPDNTTFWYVGAETVSPFDEVSAFFNFTFNLTNVVPSTINNLSLAIRYCHSGNPAASVVCDGTAPSGTVEVDQDVSFFNYSNERWVYVGTLNNSADGTAGHLILEHFYPNATLIDFINLSSNQVRVSVRAHFFNAFAENTFLALDSVNLSVDSSMTNTSVADEASLNFSRTLADGLYGWSVACTDHAANANLSKLRIIKIDTTFPRIINYTINDTQIQVNRQICLNVTVNDTFSQVASVIAELDLPVSDNINISLTNDTSNPNNCGYAKSSVWSFAYTALEEGEVNWTSLYVDDHGTNRNYSAIVGMNWSQFSVIFINSTLIRPLVNIEMNESDLGKNYSFSMMCNATCRPDSQSPCTNVAIFPRYYNGSWNDLTNFTSQLYSDQMNKTCGTLSEGTHCNATFMITSSVYAGNRNFTLQCRAKGSNTPNDFSEIMPNVTVNDHPNATFALPAYGQIIRGVFNISAASSLDDQNISNFTFSVDDNIGFSSPSTLCFNNQSNCTFNTLLQSQCLEEDDECFLLVNLTDNEGLMNSTFIRIQIDNRAPSVRLEWPLNNSVWNSSEILLNYTAFDTNLSSCSLFHNETGLFVINETNATVANNTQDFFNITFLDNYLTWNVYCNDTAGNIGFNSTNYTFYVDTLFPKINFTGPTASNDTAYSRNYVQINVTINESAFANITFYLFNFSHELINETNVTSNAFFLNFSNLQDTNQIYFYNVTVRDRLGRENSTETRRIRIDNLGPQPFSLDIQPNDTQSVNKSPFLNWTEAIDLAFQNYTLIVDDTPAFDSPEFTYRLGGNYSNNSFYVPDQWDGNKVWYWRVIAFDIFDKYTLSSQNFTYIIDNGSPQIALELPFNHSVQNESTVSFKFMANDTFTIENCTLIINNNGVFTSTEINQNATTTIQYSLQNGNYNWSINCSDKAGNVNASAFRNLTIDAPALLPISFVDTKEDDEFDEGTLHRTNVTQAPTLLPNEANVTLNYTLFNANKKFEEAGNFTSRVFDTGANNTVIDAIKWSAFLPNGSDVLGFADDTGSNHVRVFYRNGTSGIDTSQANLASVIAFTSATWLQTYSGGYSSNDILGFAFDDDGNDRGDAFVRGGTVLFTLDLTATSLNQNMAFTAGTSTWAIPADFNESDIIGFALASDVGALGQTAVFFKNGSLVTDLDSEVAPYVFSAVRRYTLPAGFDYESAVGVTYDSGANDIAMFFKNGSYVFNNNLINLSEDFAFNALSAGTYQSDQNITEMTNITLYTRASNNSLTWTSWEDHTNPISSAFLATPARYLQYRADFVTPDPYKTPSLMNVTINYTDIQSPNVTFVFPTPINGTIQLANYVYVNATIWDGHSIGACRLEFDGVNQTMLISRSSHTAICQFNKTSVSEGPHWYRIYANDSFGNIGMSEARNITIDFTAPIISSVIVNPNPANYSYDNVSVNATVIELHPNVTQANVSFPNGTTVGIFNLNFTLTPVNLSVIGVYNLTITANDSVGLFDIYRTTITVRENVTPFINGSLNRSLSAIRIFDSINASFNASDNYGLDTGQVRVNDTGIIRYFNFSLNGETISNFSQNFSVSCGRGCQVQVLGVVNDSWGNIAQNSTIFTVANTPPFTPAIVYPSAFLNTSRQPLPLNVTFRADSDNDPLSIRYYINNVQNQSSFVNTTLNASEGHYSLNVSLFDGYDSSASNASINFTLDYSPPVIFLEGPGNDTWNNSINISFRYNATDALLDVRNCSLIIYQRVNATNDTIMESTSQYLNATLNNSYGIDYYVSCSDYVGNTNTSATQRIRVDTTYPQILNWTINMTLINVNRQICLNVTVNDTFSGVQSVVAELDLPVSINENITLTNDSANPNFCSGSAGSVWSRAYTATEEGEVNWTRVYVTDRATNMNFTDVVGMNWSQVAVIFINSTLLRPQVNIEINESSVDINYSFNMFCNASCRPDSDSACTNVHIFPQYFKDSWTAITNFSSELFSYQMNKSCGLVGIGEHCNASFTISSSKTSGNANYTLRCTAKGDNTPFDFSAFIPNVTVNDYPIASFVRPEDNGHIRGIYAINASSSTDDQNITRYLFELDDNAQFNSPTTLCDLNMSNCTFNTFTQSQCMVETNNCYLRLNVTDVDNLMNSTLIRIQIDNTAPVVRLDQPSNNTDIGTPYAALYYTPFDTNLSNCTLYHNNTGFFVANETNITMFNNSQDKFNVTFDDNFITWNVYCRDLAGNIGYNVTNYTFTLDTKFPQINYTGPTLSNNTFINRNYIFVNVTINDTTFSNMTFYLYDSDNILVNETNISQGPFFINFSYLGTGQYYYNATARDRLSRENSTETRLITLDTSGPDAFDLDVPINRTETRNTTPYLNWTEAFDFQFKNYTVLIDNNENFLSPDFVYLVGQLNYSNNSYQVDSAWDGNTKWFWRVIAYDLFNQSTLSTSHFSYTIDNVSPIVTLLNPFNHSVQNQSAITFLFNVSELNTVDNCSLIVNQEAVKTKYGISSNVSNSIIYSLANANYNWSINCTDKAGNTNESIFRNLSVNAPPLMPMSFVDTKEDEQFDQGFRHRTNVTQAPLLLPNEANVSLNFTYEKEFRVYNTTGNFTSRVFDTGANNTNISFIQWEADLPTSSDVLGIVIDNGANTAAAFYRNGSHGVDTSQTNLASVVFFADTLRRWTLPAGWAYDDVVCLMEDDDGSNLLFVVHINSSIAQSAATTMNADFTFTSSAGVVTLASGFNMSDVVGCAIDTGAGPTGDIGFLFENGSLLVNIVAETPIGTTLSTALTYNIAIGKSRYDIVGFAADDGANDYMVFYKDGTTDYNDSITDNMSTSVMFRSGSSTFTVNSGAITGNNISESTAINLRTRISNDSITFSPWSSDHTPYLSGIQPNVGRYIQYQADFFTPDKFITPYLENVTINYTDLKSPRIDLVFPTPANGSFSNVNFAYINSSIIDEHSIDVCILEFSGNESMVMVRDGRNTTCFFNKTGLSEGAYHYRVFANDTFGNRNYSNYRNLTVDLTSPILTLFDVDPEPASYAISTVSVNFTVFDIYLNVTELNVSYPNGTTFSIYAQNVTLTTTNLSVPGNYTLKLFANDTAGNRLISTQHLFVRDVTKPNVTLLLPQNNSIVNNPIMQFSYNATDDWNITNCTLYLNNAQNATNHTVIRGAKSNVTTPINEGRFNWSIECIDNFGNANDRSFFTILIDRSPANITLNFPVNDLNTTESTLMFNWTTADNFDTNISCNLSINNIVMVQNITNLTSIHMNATTNLTQGYNFWNVTCIDHANNTNTSIFRNLTMIRGPSVFNASLLDDNDSIQLNWNALEYAQAYNIFIINNFTEPIGPTANFTTANTFFVDRNASNFTSRFYKVASVKGGVNKTSTRTTGKFEFELLNNSNSLYDWVLFSVPLNLSDFRLFNNSVNGTKLNTQPLYCIRSLYGYNATTGNFPRTIFNGSNWNPGAGSENFTALEAGRGYWAEINQTCNLTFVGEVPLANVSVALETGWNILGWQSANASILPSAQPPDYLQPEPPYYPVEVLPAESIQALDRYDPQTDQFEVTIHYSPNWGWYPSFLNQEFVSIEPTNGYYYDSTSAATLNYRPNTDRAD